MLLFITVVKCVFERHKNSPLKMNKMQIQIEEYYPRSDESEGEIEVYAILVTSLPPDVTDKQIKLFFKNSKKSGGGEVQKVEYDQEARSAVVTFKDAEGSLINTLSLEYKWPYHQLQKTF